MNVIEAAQTLAVLSDSELREYELIAAAAVTLLGVWLCWLAPHHRMSVEENAKDGHLTDEEARRKIKRISWAGPVVTFIGLVAVGGILLR
jgi:hypothetical protein